MKRLEESIQTGASTKPRTPRQKTCCARRTAMPRNANNTAPRAGGELKRIQSQAETAKCRQGSSAHRSDVGPIRQLTGMQVGRSPDRSPTQIEVSESATGPFGCEIANRSLSLESLY